MDKHQMIDLLTMIAVFDKRKVGQIEVEAWHRAIGNLDLDDARQAVADHFAASTDYLMPVHVAAGVKRIRAQRIERSITVPPPAELTEDSRAAQAWLQDQIKAIADGKFVNGVLGLPPGDRRPGPPPEEFQQARIDMSETDERDEEVRRVALRVACPHCHAEPGKFCTLSGTKTPLAGRPAHDARIEAANPLEVEYP